MADQRAGVADPHVRPSRNDPVARHQGRVAVGPETFEIVVKGRLSPTLVAALEGFEVSRCDQGLTHLVGWVPDQARLHSLLELLRDLNIELASVNPAPIDPDPAAGATTVTDSERRSP